MSYCPECLAEYKEGTAECIDCHVPLNPGSPPRPTPEPEAKMVRLRSFKGPTASMDADMVREVLDQEGIPCALPGETEILPGIDEVQLLVREQDATRAQEIVEAFLEAPPMDVQADDKDDEDDAETVAP